MNGQHHVAKSKNPLHQPVGGDSLRKPVGAMLDLRPKKLAKPKTPSHAKGKKPPPSKRKPKDRAAEEPVPATSKVREETDVLQEAGLPDVRVPEVLPAVAAEAVQEAAASRNPRVLRKARALQLRLQGLDYRDIRDALQQEGYKVGLKTVYYDIQRSLSYVARINGALAEEIRNLELARLDYFMNALFPQIDRGDVFAIQTALSIMDRRAKYLGLYAPPPGKGDDGGGLKSVGSGSTVNGRGSMSTWSEEQLRERVKMLTAATDPQPVDGWREGAPPLKQETDEHGLGVVRG